MPPSVRTAAEELDSAGHDQVRVALRLRRSDVVSTLVARLPIRAGARLMRGDSLRAVLQEEHLMQVLLFLVVVIGKELLRERCQGQARATAAFNRELLPAQHRRRLLHRFLLAFGADQPRHSYHHLPFLSIISFSS